MIHLPDPGLDPGANQRLNQYQREVDAVGDYPSRVAEGKRLFDNRNTKGNRTFRKVRETLARMCSGARRCVYCEDSVGDEVEHIQPKDLYPCLVFIWANYVYACGRCNGRKNNKFAVVAENRLVDVTRKRGAPIIAPVSGAPAFLNPRIDDPLAFLELDLDGTFAVLPRDELSEIDRERAEFTIETLGLNRDVLRQARDTAFRSYRARLHEYVTKRGHTAAQKLANLADGLRAMPHPTVWAEMKRQREWVPELNALFIEAPETLSW